MIITKRSIHQHPHWQAVNQPPGRGLPHLRPRKPPPPEPGQNDRIRLAHARGHVDQLRQPLAGGQPLLKRIGIVICGLFEKSCKASLFFRHPLVQSLFSCCTVDGRIIVITFSLQRECECKQGDEWLLAWMQIIIADGIAIAC